MVFVCATAQYPVGGLTAPSPRLFFFFVGRSVGLLGAGASYRASCRGSPSFLHPRAPCPPPIPRRSRVSFNAVFSLSRPVPDGDVVSGLSPVTQARRRRSRSLRHAFALRPDATIIFAFPLLPRASSARPRRREEARDVRHTVNARATAPFDAHRLSDRSDSTLLRDMMERCLN